MRSGAQVTTTTTLLVTGSRTVPDMIIDREYDAQPVREPAKIVFAAIR